MVWDGPDIAYTHAEETPKNLDMCTPYQTCKSVNNKSQHMWGKQR
jgi:hypothetical protein